MIPKKSRKIVDDLWDGDLERQLDAVLDADIDFQEHQEESA